MGGLIESRRRIFFSNRNYVTPIYETIGPADIVSFTAVHPARIAGLELAIEAFQAGSGDPSPDNVRAIEGWPYTDTSIFTLFKTGKNLFVPQWLTKGGKYVNFHGSHTPSNSDYFKRVRGIYMTAGKTYRIYVDPVLGSAASWGVYAMRTGSTSSITIKALASRTKLDTTYTPSYSGWYLFWLYAYDASTVTSINLDNLIFYIAEGDGAYDANNAAVGTRIAIENTTPPGTVYGATLDVLTGMLTVTHQYFTLTSSNSGLAVWAIGSTGHYRIRFYSSYAANPGTSSPFDGCCNCYKVISTSATYSRTTGIGIQSGNVGFIYDPTWDYSGSLPDFKTWLNSNPITMVYKRSSNLSYQLTTQTVRALVGQNNIWSGMGKTTVTYRTN